MSARLRVSRAVEGAGDGTLQPARARARAGIQSGSVILYAVYNREASSQDHRGLGFRV